MMGKYINYLLFYISVLVSLFIAAKVSVVPIGMIAYGKRASFIVNLECWVNLPLLLLLAMSSIIPMRRITSILGLIGLFILLRILILCPMSWLLKPYCTILPSWSWGNSHLAWSLNNSFIWLGAIAGVPLLHIILAAGLGIINISLYYFVLVCSCGVKPITTALALIIISILIQLFFASELRHLMIIVTGVMILLSRLVHLVFKVFRDLSEAEIPK